MEYALYQCVRENVMWKVGVLDVELAMYETAFVLSATLFANFEQRFFFYIYI